MAAGLGFKTFNTGDVLTAGDTNGYLMQGVWVFANATARDAAVTSPQEGNTCYLKDTDVIQVYSGSAWVTKSGGASPLTTKGDLYTYSTTDARLAVGTNGYVLTADSAEATGLKWAAAAGGGKVLQVVQGTTTTATTVASTTYTDSTLTANITPSATTSKVLVLFTQNIYGLRLTDQAGGGVRLVRGSTTIWNGGGTNSNSTMWVDAAGSGTTSLALGWYCTGAYLDSPATTSSTTYKTQVRAHSTANSGAMYLQNAGETSTIILMEIGA